MTDDELRREASSLMLQILSCLTSSDNGKLVGITEGGATAIGEALRRVRDAATAAERQRCAAVVRNGNWYCDCSDEAGFALGEAAAAIERQEG